MSKTVDVATKSCQLLAQWCSNFHSADDTKESAREITGSENVPVGLKGRPGNSRVCAHFQHSKKGVFFTSSLAKSWIATKMHWWPMDAGGRNGLFGCFAHANTYRVQIDIIQMNSCISDPETPVELKNIQTNCWGKVGHECKHI